MTSPHRGEQQAAPAKHGIIRFPFCQQSRFVRAVSKVSVTLAGCTHLPPNPTPTRRVRQLATQFRLYSQKGKECRDTSLLEEPLDTRVSGCEAGNKCPSTPLI